MELKPKAGTAQSVQYLACGMENWRIAVWFSAGTRDFFSYKIFRPHLGPNKFSIQCVTQNLPRWKDGRDMKLAIHPQIVPKSRMNVAIPSFLHMLSWRNIGTTFTFTWLSPVILYHLLRGSVLLVYTTCCVLLSW